MAAALLAAFAGAVTAASAGAAVLATDEPCYLPGQQMIVAGQGFAPSAPVQVASGGVLATPTADAAGSFQASAAAPALPFSTPSARSLALTATDGTTSATVRIRVANLAALHSPRSPSQPQSRVRWRISGLRPGARVYAHYVHAGREQRRVSFGRMPERCSVLRKRIAMLPVDHPAAGRWRIQIDTRARYSPRTRRSLVEFGTVGRRIVG
ncbi:hypothetical protein [Capillimicrobium parvum]|uniref:IPT/TIG domain-containing protein n=1 Tax=Capillimicrobium parvum TaxID=2884022 RepID=A0A9E7BZI7_9ACTN|nr:hypothetical protein [Capillimicrobium parvum]UGS35371.1 hypothetical protein DSM104329_01759 [Capillimicrobium parvum]